MLEYILFGGSYAFASAIQPGPLQAFLLSRVAQAGWRRTLPAALSPLLSDGPIAIVMLVVLKRVEDRLGWILQIAGGFFLLYLAVSAYRQWKRHSEAGSSASSAPRTVLQAALVNILNPNPYLGWSLVLGPQFLKAWSVGPANAVALVGAFYATMVVSLALTIMLFGASRLLGPRGRRGLVLISAAALAALGVYLLFAGFLKSAGSMQ